MPLVPPVPLPNRYAAPEAEPAFNAPVRWTLRVLAWLAFGVASYLAWHSINQTSVAGCGIGASNGCDVVLTSSWSKWLNIPVAVLGMACYATLATLSVLLGLRNAVAGRWIATIFVMLSMVAAAASAWFIGVQIFAIGSFCWYCLATDVFGIGLGLIATVFAVRAVSARRVVPQPRGMQPGLMALRTAMPAGSRNAPAPICAQTAAPWMMPAVGIAIPFVAILIGGQVLFRGKTHLEAKPSLPESIQLVGAKAADPNDASATAKEHSTMRVPAENEGTERAAESGDAPGVNKASDATKETSSGGAQPPQPAAEPAPPTKERLIKVLGGKLTLDVYQHPIIGSPEAPHIAVELVSYDCSHCRKMHETMKRALDLYGDQVALLILVQPLEKECNRLITDPAASHQGACTIARLAVGIGKLNPPAFASFHDFLMSGDKEKPPAMDKIIPKAYVLADRSRLREMTHSEALKKQIDGNINLYELLQKQHQGNKKFGLPVQILGDYTITGSVEKEEDVFKAWEEHLGVKPK